MRLNTYLPCTLLQPYVSAIWDYQDLLRGENLALSILPDTATYLCFLYEDRLTTAHKDRVYTTRSGLAGFQSFRSDLGGSGRVSGVSARLTPWGLQVFRRGIVKDCAERRVDCRDIFPPYAVEQLEDRLAAAVSVAERVGQVEGFLLERLDPHQGDALVQTACKALNQSKGGYAIATLAQTLGLSKRSLERRFLNHIGTTPKKYARIVRLRAALKRRAELPGWADVAHDLGYYDQSHLIHDFQALYGYSPDALYPNMLASPTLRFSGLLNLQGLG